MDIIPASDKKYAHVVISKEDLKKIQEKVKKQLDERVRRIFANSTSHEKK
ncbi:MAG: hypothetical protein KAX39_03350 [candidate division Zixibacteria bacterium]|nr:hypothetical protein [candidate division Zixibacteria bacterium]